MAVVIMQDGVARIVTGNGKPKKGIERTLWGIKVLDAEDYWKQARPATRQNKEENTKVIEGVNAEINKRACAIETKKPHDKQLSREFIKLINQRREKIEKKYAKRKKRKRKQNRPHPDMIQQVLNRDNHTCLECGSKEHLEVHHMVYRSHGGSHELDNLITLCWTCHAEKHKEEPVYRLMMKRING